MLPYSVHKPYLPIRACNQSRFMRDRIGPRMKICVNSGLPIGMVPCLHQSNVNIKRKLRVWRAQKCTPLLGGKRILANTGLQTIPFHAVQHDADKGNLRKFWPTYNHGTAFAPLQCLCQKQATRMKSHKMCSPPRFKTRTYQYGSANYTVLEVQYRAKNRNLRKFGVYLSSWYHVSTKGTFRSK